MDKNQKIAVGVIVIIAIVAAWQLGKRPSNDTSNNQQQEQGMETSNNSEAETETEEKPATTPAKPQNGQAWEGILEASDNTGKGNYKIIVDNHVIYIRTSRDYSALVGRQVKVNYEGTLESFRLGEITEQ